MNKSYTTEFQRIFLCEGLPEPLTRASKHLQLFDNYIADTRLRLRTIRDPETKLYTHILDQRIFPTPSDLSEMRLAQLFLNEEEYARFEMFEGREIRKNRYYYETEEMVLEIDVYLGSLWGLNRIKAGFNDITSLNSYRMPDFAIIEVTSDPFFDDASLVDMKFDDIQSRLAEENAPTAQAMEQK